MSQPEIPITTNHCQDIATCPGGNCPGCRDSALWCKDPRCHPRCEDCPEPRSEDVLTTTTIVVIIVVIILAILLAFWAYGGYQEPKQLPGFVPDHMKYEGNPFISRKNYRHTGWTESPALAVQF